MGNWIVGILMGVGATLVWWLYSAFRRGDPADRARSGASGGEFDRVERGIEATQRELQEGEHILGRVEDRVRTATEAIQRAKAILRGATERSRIPPEGSVDVPNPSGGDERGTDSVPSGR